MKEETKSKSIIIDADLHYKLKMFCKGKSMKIGGVVEDLIKLYIKNTKGVQNLLDEFNEKD